MTFTLPTFNLTCNIWHDNGTFPPTGAPDLSSKCNLAYGRRSNVGLGPESIGIYSGVMTLLLPLGTDIRDYQSSLLFPDKVEVPAGSGRYYAVNYADDVGKGFPNEHRAASLIKSPGQNTWPRPMP